MSAVPAWLGEAFRDALRAAWRGVAALGTVLLHPFESAALVLTSPWVFGRAMTLFRAMYRTGVVVLTPPAEPLLRTAITGLGGVTTSVAVSDAVTPALVSAHFGNLRAALAPFDRASQALLRFHALCLSASAYVAFRTTWDQGLPNLAERIVLSAASAAAASLVWSLGLRLLAGAAIRLVRRWLNTV